MHRYKGHIYSVAFVPVDIWEFQAFESEKKMRKKNRNMKQVLCTWSNPLPVAHKGERQSLSNIDVIYLQSMVNVERIFAIRKC